MKKGRMIPFAGGIFLIFGLLLITATETLDSANGQTNSTINQTSTTTGTPAMTTSAQDEASQSIRGAITETGEFLGNVTDNNKRNLRYIRQCYCRNAKVL